MKVDELFSIQEIILSICNQVNSVFDDKLETDVLSRKGLYESRFKQLPDDIKNLVSERFKEKNNASLTSI